MWWRKGDSEDRREEGQDSVTDELRTVTVRLPVKAQQIIIEDLPPTRSCPTCWK
jgi:hypothetical protein